LALIRDLRAGVPPRSQRSVEQPLFRHQDPG